VLHYITDPRSGPASLLLGLGIPVTLNSDDPGKFGLEDTTMDYMVSFISSNWSLKHLKLIAIHSINHAICSEETKKELLSSFNSRWDQWIHDFIT
jgi:adenosine deaminase